MPNRVTIAKAAKRSSSIRPAPGFPPSRSDRWPWAAGRTSRATNPETPPARAARRSRAYRQPSRNCGRNLGQLLFTNDSPVRLCVRSTSSTIAWRRRHVSSADGKNTSRASTDLVHHKPPDQVGKAVIHVVVVAHASGGSRARESGPRTVERAGRSPRRRGRARAPSRGRRHPEAATVSLPGLRAADGRSRAGAETRAWEFHGDALGQPLVGLKEWSSCDPSASTT